MKIDDRLTVVHLCAKGDRHDIRVFFSLYSDQYRTATDQYFEYLIDILFITAQKS